MLFTLITGEECQRTGEVYARAKYRKIIPGSENNKTEDSDVKEGEEVVEEGEEEEDNDDSDADSLSDLYPGR